LINSDRGHIVVAVFSDAPAGAREALDRLGTDDGLQDAKRSFCSRISGAGDCELRPAVFGGHNAATGKIEIAPQGRGKFVLVATSKHAYFVLFVEHGTVDERANSTVDAMIASIETN